MNVIHTSVYTMYICVIYVSIYVCMYRDIYMIYPWITDIIYGLMAFVVYTLVLMQRSASRPWRYRQVLKRQRALRSPAPERSQRWREQTTTGMRTAAPPRWGCRGSGDRARRLGSGWDDCRTCYCPDDKFLCSHSLLCMSMMIWTGQTSTNSVVTLYNIF